ncbi:MAG: twin-arginine translocation signal domain-containing protein [Tannerellaceae bacterium]|nr:twin-arginine translocation signal domain-containing protein [Tannerellaceae bacterium]
MVTRRGFLKTSAAVAALSIMPKGFAAVSPSKEKAIGVQLYSVRDDL